jgi:hypothetical protein
MAYKLQVVDNNLGISTNVRYENLSKLERPEVVAKTPTGKIAKERSVVNGKVIAQGEMTRQWVDEDGTVFGKTELTFWYNNEQVSENTQTKVLQITGYQPLTNYTDNYVIAAYYEIFPDDNGMKKDFDRERAKSSNLFQMRKLWEYLDTNKVVARGEFVPSSRGFISSDGYIRAVSFGNHWGLEIGLFKEAKNFQHLNEGVPKEVSAPAIAEGGRKKIKMV